MDSSYSQLMQSVMTATKSIFPDNKVIVANQSENEPDGPYVAFSVIRDTQIGLSYHDTQLSSSNINITRANYEVLIQFSFVSREMYVSGDMVKTFIQALSAPPTREIFRKNKLSRSSASPSRYVPSKRESTWVHYHLVDVTFTYSVETRQSMIPIVTAEITDDITGTVYTVPPDVVIP